MAGGVVWIGLVAVLLAGVVALNVAVLRLNVQLDQTQLSGASSERTTRSSAPTSPLGPRPGGSSRWGPAVSGSTPATPNYLDLRK